MKEHVVKIRPVAFVFVTASMLACGFLKKKEEVTDPGPVTTAEVSPNSVHGPAVNESTIKRYHEEKKFADEQEGVLMRDVVARSESSGGSVVSSLPAGTGVATVSSLVPSYILIKFLDPTNNVRRMGWIEASAFTAQSLDAGTTRDAAAWVIRDAGPKDASAKDAGDAGKIADASVADAAVREAGATMQVSKPAVNGKCDPGWVIFPTGEKNCRKTCKADAECGGLKCTQKGSQKLCGM
jgi:hypothetical protein